MSPARGRFSQGADGRTGESKASDGAARSDADETEPNESAGFAAIPPTASDAKRADPASERNSVTEPRDLLGEAVRRVIRAFAARDDEALAEALRAALRALGVA